MRRNLLILAIMIALAPAAARGQAIQVDASVSTNAVGLQDQFQLEITVSGQDSGEAEPPRLPTLSGFQVVAGPSVSTQFRWVNGRSSNSKSFIYILLPEKTGEFTIDPVEVRVAGKAFKTQPIAIRVMAESAQPPQPAPGRRRPLDPFWDEDMFGRSSRSGARQPSGDIFVSAEFDRTTAYPGQQVTLSYHLYTQVSITGIQLQESPPLVGFWVEDLKVPENPAGVRKVINGQEYLEYVIKKQALFPNTTGELKIPPSTFAVSAKSTGDLFSFFGQAETLFRKTKEIVLNVKPLPAQSRPPNFGSAVGSFNLTADLDKTEAATGEAVTLRIRLSGRGNLKMIPDIALPSLPDFTVYSSKTAENVRPFEGDLIGGDKTWELIIVPKAPGEQTIPALSLSYFDALKEKYETVTTSPLSLRVVRGADSDISGTLLSRVNKQSVTRQGTDINFIKLAGGDLDSPSEPPYRAAWFYVLAGLPVVLNVGAFLYQRERAKRSDNVVLARSLRARRVALAKLKGAERRGRTDARAFYDQAALALEGYLADKLNLPEIGVSGDPLERTLAERAVSSETVKETLSCLQECDFGRFVSASAAPEKMRELALRIRRVIDALEKL